MANDRVTIWNGLLKFGRPPANGELLIGDGATNEFSLSTLTAGSNTTITNSGGVITISSYNPGGTLTAVTASTPLTSSGGTTPNIALATPLTVQYGGTGLGTLTSNYLLAGNGAGNVNLIAPGANGNVLTSNGTTWSSAAPPVQWIRVVKKTTQTITASNTNFVDDAELFFSVVSGKTYAIRGYYVTLTPSGTAGTRFSINSTAGAASFMSITTPVSGSTTTTQAWDQPIYSNVGASLQYGLFYTGVFTVSASGTVVMRLAKASAAAGTTTFYAGSYLEYAEIM